MKSKSLLLASMVSTASAADIMLEDFSQPTHTWRQVNDPVMGGQSTGTFAVVDGVGVFDGEVVDVPSLSAPGFVKVQSSDKTPFPDISSCTALGLTLKNGATDAYEGYRLSVGSKRPPPGIDGVGFFTSGHKAPFQVGDKTRIEVPISEFSNAWSDASGDIVKECAEDARLCLTEDVLKNVGSVQVWGEGKGGSVHLEIANVFASGCGSGEKKAIVTEVANLAKFDGAEDISTHDFSVLNDPVMGGRSTSTFALDEENKVMKLSGNVAIVPSLSAPGFVVLQSKNPLTEKFADISAATHVLLRVKSSIPYAGFKISFAADTLNYQFKSFKANFELKSNGEFEDVAIPLSSFSDEWSSATGESTCPEGKDCSPATEKLSKITNVGFWLEGAEGDFDVEIESIRAGIVVDDDVQKEGAAALANGVSLRGFATMTK